MRTAWRARLGGLAWWLREYFGENDYARYREAWRARHAAAGDTCDAAGHQHHLMTEREYFTWRLSHKYGSAINHC